MKRLYAGFCEGDITPKDPVLLCGQFGQRVSKYVESPLKANACAITKENESVILVGCDLVEITDKLLVAVREEVGKRCPEIPKEALVIGAIHTHTATDYDDTTEKQLWGCESFFKNGAYVERDPNPHMSRKDALAYTASTIADTVVRAWERRAPVSVAGALGRASTGHCRRVVYKDGHCELYGEVHREDFSHFESGEDSGVDLLYFFDEGKKPIGVVAAVACPAQTQEFGRYISADVWHPVREFTKARLGEDFVTVGFCAAAGCQSPVDLVREDLGLEPSMRTPEGTTLLGRRISDAIVGELANAKERANDDVPFLHKKEILQLPLRKTTKEEADAARAFIENFLAENDKQVYSVLDAVKLYDPSYTVTRYEQQQKNDIVQTEIHAVRIGEIAIVTNPFELFLDYGIQMKVHAKTKHLFVVQLTNGSLAYLPTKIAEQGGGYSAFLASGTVGHEGGEILVKESVKLVNSIFDEK